MRRREKSSGIDDQTNGLELDSRSLSNQNPKIPKQNLKIVIIGPNNVQKNNFIKRFIENEEEYKAIEQMNNHGMMNYHEKTFSAHRLMIHEIITNKTSQTLLPAYFSGCHAIVIIIDRSQQENLNFYYNHAISHLNLSKNTSIIIAYDTTHLAKDEKHETSKNESDNEDKSENVKICHYSTNDKASIDKIFQHITDTYQEQQTQTDKELEIQTQQAQAKDTLVKKLTEYASLWWLILHPTYLFCWRHRERASSVVDTIKNRKLDATAVYQIIQTQIDYFNSGAAHFHNSLLSDFVRKNVFFTRKPKSTDHADPFYLAIEEFKKSYESTIPTSST